MKVNNNKIDKTFFMKKFTWYCWILYTFNYWYDYKTRQNHIRISAKLNNNSRKLGHLSNKIISLLRTKGKRESLTISLLVDTKFDVLIFRVWGIKTESQ